ncbi:hypothetical protein [Streptomyces sp. 8N616]|uniref:hypothetical protein n=1 Tax=Streptomyces sp. 8N616 TaxID=3457414 RepID=UPI003FD64A0A
MHFARSGALAVLRTRGAALAVALLPTAVAVVLLVADATGRIGGSGWDAVRWTFVAVAAVVLLLAVAIAAVVVKARPAVSPTVPIPEEAAPDLYRLVRDLADRLDVPAPSAIALTPDCDSWLEDRTHPATAQPPEPARGAAATPAGQARSAPAEGKRRGQGAPVLVIGSPFMWWMRVAELRAILAPVVAGTGPSAHPDIAAARRFVRGLDAAVAVAARRPHLAFVGWTARLLLRGCRDHAAEMERGVAAAASARAQAVDYGLRIVAQEQVGLAYAGWDRLLTRVALPAWRMGRWPSRLDAGVVSALTELSRRDRLAEGFATRLGERPACDLLEEPGLVDEAASLLAARLFHGGPATPGPDWSPVDWATYPEEVVDRKWRREAARLHRILDELPPQPRARPHGPTETAATASSNPSNPSNPSHPSKPTNGPAGTGALPGGAAEPPPRTREVPADVADPAALNGSPGTTGAALGAEAGDAREPDPADPATRTNPPAGHVASSGPSSSPSASSSPNSPSGSSAPSGEPPAAPTLARVVDRLASADRVRLGEKLAARLSEEVAREEAAARAAAAPPGASGAEGAEGANGHDTEATDSALWSDTAASVPLFPVQAPRTGRELLADHITAMVCCAAVDTAGAAPGLDWLDGPVLLVAGKRGADLGTPVLNLLEDGDPEPLRDWLTAAGVRPEKPVRLV